jgi:dipeptidyl aminopeptidase/acylaminoacyl peptidase
MRSATLRHTRYSLLRRGAALVGILLVLIGLWLLTTEDARVWPVRNTLHYRALMAWWGQVGEPNGEGTGSLVGTVRDAEGKPIEGARVLVTQWDGTSFSARSDEAGRYRIPNVPVGRYRPVAGASGFEDVMLREVQVGGNAEVLSDVTLDKAKQRLVPPATSLEIGEPTTLTCEAPLPSQATRRAVRWKSEGQPNEPTFFYTPITSTAESELRTLLAVYPGPANEWECVSVPLAAAGYAVLGAGPSYSLDLEGDVDELQQALGFAREGAFPNADGERIAVLGGSYSTILTQRLMQRDGDLDAAVLLGPPTDLFDMRRRFEAGTFVPPFGLDRVLVALGLPSDEPLRYWQYSGAYHVRPDLPPLVIFHSRTDEVVPYQQSELLATTLVEEGAEHELYLFDGASHYLLEGSEDALEIYRVTLEFLEEHLR